MRKPHTLLLAGIVYAMSATTSTLHGYQDSSAQAPSESLKAWEWMESVTMPERAGLSPYVDFVLTPSVFDKARADLNDLRLYDSKDREVPFVVQIMRALDKQDALSARSFNSVRNPDRS